MVATLFVVFVVFLPISTDVEGYVVVLGRQSQENSNPNEVSLNISEIIIHPEYNSSTYDNDICLLRLSSPVEFNNYIMSVCLAAQSSTIHAGTVSWVTGWGNINFGGQYINRSSQFTQQRSHRLLIKLLFPSSHSVTPFPTKPPGSGRARSGQQTVSM